jgi:hypothetical protein
LYENLLVELKKDAIKEIRNTRGVIYPEPIVSNGTPTSNISVPVVSNTELTTPHAINDSPQTKLSKEEVSKLTIPKIKKLLDDLDIKYKSKNKKDALIDLYLK